MSDRFYCWSCGSPVNRGNGISLSGDRNDSTTRYEVCHECRDKLTPRDLILLNMLLRPRDQGGLGAVDALEQIVRLIGLSIEMAGNGDGSLWDRLTGRPGEEN